MSRKHNNLGEALTPSINKAVAGQFCRRYAEKEVSPKAERPLIQAIIHRFPD